MKAKDWQHIGRLLETPDTDSLAKILRARTHDEAYAVVDGVPRDACRALRHLADELGGVSSDALREAEEARASSARRVRELEDALGIVRRMESLSLARIPRPPKQSATKHIATAHVTMTDVHCGLEILIDLAYGKNEYSLAIMRQRMALWAHRTARLVKLRSQHRHIDTLVVWGLSDFLNNELHEGDGAQSCVLGVAQAAEVFTATWAAGLKQLRGSLPDVNIHVVVVPGNHDRTTRKPDSSRGAATSWSWMIGAALENHHALQDAFKWIRPLAPMVVVACPDGMRVRGVHGNEFLYQKGIGGPDVSIRRALRLLDKIEPADTMVLGHFHFPCTPGDFLISGAFCGSTPWSLNRMYPEAPPSQLFWLTDSHYGLSGIERIGLR